jgi:hypothetical protein
MSEILIGSNPDNPEVVGAVNFEATAEEKAKQLPKPSGYHILCAIPPVEKEFDSGIVKADTTVHYEELLTTVLWVHRAWPRLLQGHNPFSKRALV